MSNVPVFVGLDYHQDSIQVCVLNQKGDVLLNRAAANDCQELGRIVQPLGVVQRVGIEACCGAADLGEQLVQRLGWNVSLGHPAYIAKIKSSPEQERLLRQPIDRRPDARGLSAARLAARRRTSASCANW